MVQVVHGLGPLIVNLGSQYWTSANAGTELKPTLTRKLYTSNKNIPYEKVGGIYKI